MKESEQEKRIKKIMTDQFTKDLIELYRLVGWHVDLIEVNAFITFACEVSGKDFDPVDPYEIQYDGED